VFKSIQQHASHQRKKTFLFDGFPEANPSGASRMFSLLVDNFSRNGEAHV
jgi:hypothetical protein